ncbi:MAG: N-acetyltransferase [Alphaproteobacteria bacterium]|nr:N-acetyltransferase [Alphaproteobacteria bacterium]
MTDSQPKQTKLKQANLNQANLNQANLRQETPYPHPQAETLLNQAFKGNRLKRDVYLLRDCAPEYRLCWVIENSQEIIAMIRYWEVKIDRAVERDNRFLLLGPLAVSPQHTNQGYGKQLIQHTLALAKETAFHAVFVSGDLTYYQKLGFAPVPIQSPSNSKPNSWQIYPLKSDLPDMDTPFSLVAVD